MFWFFVKDGNEEVESRSNALQYHYSPVTPSGGSLSLRLFIAPASLLPTSKKRTTKKKSSDES